MQMYLCLSVNAGIFSMNTTVDEGVCMALISLPADCWSVYNANTAACYCAMHSVSDKSMLHSRAC